MTFSDADLVRKCLNGEDTAYGFLVDKYKGSVFALVRKTLGHHHDAEDVAQEVFLRAYRSLPTLREPDRFSGWLYIITHNECRRWLKRQAQEKAARLSMTEIASHKHAYAYQTQQMQEQLHTAIDALPRSEQTVIHLHYFSGLTCDEISNSLGTSKDAVKMRLSRARAKLRSGQSAQESAASIKPKTPRSPASAEELGTLFEGDEPRLSVPGEDMIEMLEEGFSVDADPIPMEFTLQIMECIQQMRFVPPNQVLPIPSGDQKGARRSPVIGINLRAISPSFLMGSGADALAP